MKKIAIDMDEVIADFISKHLRLYAQQYGEILTADDLAGTRLWKIRPHLEKELLQLVDDPHFFRDLGVMEGSQETIRELSKYYEIFITTAAMEHPSSFSAKYEWLREHFSFLPDSHFVFCGDKSILHADFLIDDNCKHFNRFKGQGILFTAMHNINEKGYVRVNNWNEVSDFFLAKNRLGLI